MLFFGATTDTITLPAKDHEPIVASTKALAVRMRSGSRILWGRLVGILIAASPFSSRPNDRNQAPIINRVEISINAKMG
jgi:hypothetical protein